MNAAYPNRTSFYKPAHLYSKRPFQRTSAVRSQFRAPWVPTVNRKFPTSSTKFSTADMGKKGNAVKASACWIWKPSQNTTNKGPNSNSVSGNSQNHIDDKGYWDSGCSQHMTGNISYLTKYEPYDGGRLGHLNFKTINRLVRHNLVRGLPSKCFDNDHTCAACLKGKQHKASCKTKLINSMTKPLHTLHMDLFGPTS
nr:ribonuclease H-like domain-containing protein [Tanacetum cinerariifolium]